MEEVTSCCGEVLLCRMMDGAASADDRPGVMFTAELCVPWDAPEAVVDVNSEELISHGHQRAHSRSMGVLLEQTMRPESSYT